MMQNKPLISIIIPVYNREKLVEETLDSILKQTFHEWECILVDDGSTDSTYTILQQYQKKDSRFIIFERPISLKKGANSCRNYGFKKTNGNYIKWFDSDDIMLPHHLEIAYQTLIENKLDFVITDTENFDTDTREITDKPYDFDRDNRKINVDDFARHKIGWITDDFLGTRQIVEKISFNENITTDGDEYNFFVRILSQCFKGEFINKIVTHRRIHTDTLTKTNDEKSLNYLNKISNIKYQTANDLVVYNNHELICWFLSGYMKNAYEMAILKQPIPNKKEAFKLICRYSSINKGLVFMSALILATYFNKGYNVMKYARS